MKCVLLYNPEAGDGDDLAKDVAKALEKQGYRVKAFHRDSDKVAKVLQSAPDLVAIMGGDGTVGGLLTHLEVLTVPVLVLPTGTANNVARSLGIEGSPEEIVRGLDASKMVPLDVGLVAGPFGARSFIESVGFGLLAAMLDLHVDGSSREERLSLARSALAEKLDEHEERHARVRVDGRVHKGPFLMIEATSIGRVGPGLALAPDAKADDGQLDVILLEPGDRAAMIDWLTGEMTEAPPVRREVGAVVEIESEDHLRIDDEAVATQSPLTRILVGAGTAKLRVLVPRNRRS